MKTWTTILILLFLFTFISGKLAKKPRILLGSWKPEDLLPASYNRLKSPVSEQSPGRSTEVHIGLNITSILGVNEADQSYRIRCTLSQRWVEQRLNYPSSEEYNRIFLTPSVVDKLWVPHIFISNSVNEMEAMESPLIMYDVNREKEVTVVSRMSVKVACDFDLSLFPHDTQVCHVILESLTNTKRSVNFTWSYFHLLHEESARFKFNHLSYDYCPNSRGSEFSCLRASFQLQRRLGYYTIKIYGPSLLVVITTFIGFWFPVQGLPARTLIVVLPLLALVTQQSQVNNEIVVSYVVALHVWFIVCTTYIFAALVELAVALVYCQNVQDWKDNRDVKGKQSTETVNEETQIPTVSSSISPITTIGVIPSVELDIGPKELKESKLSKENGHHFLNGNSHRYSHGAINGDILKSERKDSACSHKTHVMKTILKQVYGQVDWRKSPQVRNKIDYVSRILFPSTFIVFVFCYFMVLNTR